MSFFPVLFSLAISAGLASAAPQGNGLLSGVGDVVDGVVDGVGDLVGGELSSLSKNLEIATATLAGPSAIAEASRRVSSVVQAQATAGTYVQVAADLVESGLTLENGADALDFVTDILEGENSSRNVNLRNPQPAAFPKAGSNDAPYSVSEAKLRAAIYIPSGFQYGRQGAPQPIILVPGTGNTGFVTFSGSYIPLLQGSKIADPVWLNIPGYLYNDAQTNAEYVAYAINYIHGISMQKNVAVLSWSQGGIDAQWAFKYWPSTRARVTDLIAFSPDFHGSVIADLVDLGEPLPPSILQQQYNSNFITALRARGGDSAYVPTTSIYSGLFDEIVEPQQGTNASAFILDARNKGVSNNEVQTVCPPGNPGGSFYTHEGTLYNPLGFALAVDALKNPGPGRASRLDLSSVCSTYLTPGLDLADFLLTENAILVAGAALVAYPNKVLKEPAIRCKRF